MAALKAIINRALIAIAAMRRSASRHALSVAVVGGLFACCLVLSAIIPPFQSPDEFDHVARAYFLRNGHIRLVSSDRGSGGTLDGGLDAYMRAYSQLPYAYERKFTREEHDLAEQINWLGSDVFSPAPGTRYYFPAIYVPQALGLLLGERCGLNVGGTYRLARFCALLAACILILAAFCMVPPSPFLLAVLFLPMSIFQMASASLDGMSNALSLFILASYWRTKTSSEVTNRQLAALAIAITVLATARLHAIPLTLLLFAGYWNKHDRRWLWAGGVALLVIVAWTGYTMVIQTDPPGTGPSTFAKLRLYLTHPLKIALILRNTLTNESQLRFYAQSFIGYLGWLDAPLSTATYHWLGALLVSLMYFSTQASSFCATWRPRLLFMACAILSVLVIFAALILTWTPYNSSMVMGVQGRYFVLPAMLLAYGLQVERGALQEWKRFVGWAAFIVFCAISVLATTKCLIVRYYESDAPLKSPSYRLIATSPISAGSEQPIKFDERQREAPRHLYRIGVRFGTHRRLNKGKGELRLQTLGGHTYRKTFNLADLTDNQYHFFELDGFSYTSGSVAMLEGGGVSLWETFPEDTQVGITCLALGIYDDGQRITPGCPHP